MKYIIVRRKEELLKVYEHLRKILPEEPDCQTKKNSSVEKGELSIDTEGITDCLWYSKFRVIVLITATQAIIISEMKILLSKLIPLNWR